MSEQRYCTSCRAPLPAGAAWCEACGTDAGDLFDGRVRAPRSSRRVWPILLVLALAAGGTAVWMYRSKIPMLRSKPVFDTGPARVVGQRPGGSRRAPGAKLSEPEAMQTLRRFLATQIKSECLAVASRGYGSDAYTFDAVDSCKGTKLGRWRVDGRTGEVRQFRAGDGG